jgi:hypothetical protein
MSVTDGGPGRAVPPRSPGRECGTPFPIPGGPLRPAEVRELWAFLHGDVMVPGIRRTLREALGLCPRHTWCYAIVEIELWLTGGGVRGGHQPFDVCVLYEDLLAAAIDRLERRRLPRRHRVARVLERRAPCRVCETLTGPGGAQSVPSYAAAQTIALTAEANQLRYTLGWCRETVDVWRDRICPACAAAYTDTHGRGDVIPSTATGLLCRQHLRTVPAPAPP